MFMLVVQILLRIVVSIVGLLLVGLILAALHRMWWTRGVVLRPVTFVRNGQAIEEEGVLFSKLLADDISDISRFYGTSSDRHEPLSGSSTWSGYRNGIAPLNPAIDLPRFANPTLPNVRVQLYGMQFALSIERFINWLCGVTEIRGHVLINDGRASLFAEGWVAGVSDPLELRVLDRESAAAAREELACKIVRRLGRRSSPLFGDPLNEQLDSEFAQLTQAFRVYAQSRAQHSDWPGSHQRDEFLANARQIVDQLRKSTNLAHVHALAYEIYRDIGDYATAQESLAAYCELSTRAGMRDDRAFHLLSRLRGSEYHDAGELLPTPSETVVYPGSRIQIEGREGTVCCVLRRNLDGAQYLVSASYVTTALTSSEPVPLTQNIQRDGSTVATPIASSVPLPLDESKSPIAGSFGTARLHQNVRVESIIPKLGKVQAPLDASAIHADMRVIVLGGGSGLTRTTVADAHHPVRVQKGNGEASVVETIRLRSGMRPGDAGAPVLTPDLRLIGMVFLGDEMHTVAVPIGILIDSANGRLCTE